MVLGKFPHFKAWCPQALRVGRCHYVLMVSVHSGEGDRMEVRVRPNAKERDWK